MTSAEQLKADVKFCAETIEQVVAGTSEFGDIAEYFSDALDVEIICDLRGDYREARIALTIGGPSIYLNTRTNCIEGYWWSDSAEYHVNRAAVDAVDEYFEEIWEMTRGH